MKAREMDRAVRSVVNRHTNNQRAIAQIQQQKEADKNQTVFVDKLTENILIEIPDDINSNELPALLSAIYYFKKTSFDKADAWSSMRKNYKRELTLNIDVVSSGMRQDVVNQVLQFPLRKLMSVYSYDMYYKFDAGIMRTFRSNGKFHASSAYGIVLGCEAQSMFEIPVEDIIYKDDRIYTDIIVLDDIDDTYKEVWEWLGTAVPNLKVSRVIPIVNSFRGMITAINDAQLVVGATSFYTYMACCMGKPVFELYPTDISRNWLSKWSHPNYSMYICDRPDKEILLKGVSYLWQKSRAQVRLVQAQ